MPFRRILAGAVVATAAAVATAPAQEKDWERLQQATEQVRELQERLRTRNRELEQQVERLQARLGRDETVGGSGNDRRAGGPRTPNPNEACFFDRTNFEGEFFCAKRGNSDADLTNEGWSDRISSFRLGGQARVLLCENPDLLGHCIGVGSDLKSLPDGWSTVISSYLVR